MNMDERIARINELYHKSQKEGLTKDEKEEQSLLRQEYIDSVRGSLKSQLDNVDIKEKDGSITNLGEKVRNKTKEKESAPLNIKKSSLRKDFLKKRDSISESERMSKSRLIESRLYITDEYKNAGLILLYASYGSEVHTFGIMERAINDGKRVAFPKCVLNDGIPSLDFYEVHNISELSGGYKGILEPDTQNHSLKKIEEEADLCIVPGIAFTRKGYRIGYGKGFYDRFIAKGGAKHYTALAFKMQLTHEIFNDEFDRAVNTVITEDSIYVCS